MYFVVNSIANKVYIADTKDGVIEAVSNSDYRSLLSSGVEIASKYNPHDFDEQFRDSAAKKLYNFAKRHSNMQDIAEYLCTHIQYTLLMLFYDNSAGGYPVDASLISVYPYLEQESGLLITTWTLNGKTAILVTLDYMQVAYWVNGVTKKNPIGSGYFIRNLLRPLGISIDLDLSALYMVIYSSNKIALVNILDFNQSLLIDNKNNIVL